MKYVIVEDESVVHLGPMTWNTRMFNSVLHDELGLAGVVTLLPGHEAQVPLTINNVKILPVMEEVPDYDPLTEELAGPAWRFTSDLAIATYTKVDRPLEHLKSDLKRKVADERYKKEVSGVKLMISGTEVSLDTSREGRVSYAHQYMLMSEQDVISWKFPEGWVGLRKQDLARVISEVNKIVQDAFEWERSQAQLIDSESSSKKLKELHDQLPRPRGALRNG